MATAHLIPFTAETAREAMAKRKASREAANLLSEDAFLRARYWEDAARVIGVRLPDWSEPITSRRVEQWMHRLGLTGKDVAPFLGDENGSFPGHFAANNPRWPLRALIGTVVENVCGTWHGKTFERDQTA